MSTTSSALTRWAAPSFGKMARTYVDKSYWESPKKLVTLANRSGWWKPIVVAPKVGIQDQFDGYFYPPLAASLWEPQSQISFSPNGRASPTRSGSLSLS